MTGDSFFLKAPLKVRAGGLVLAATVILVMGILNLPYQYANVAGQWRGVIDVEATGSYLISQNMPRMAGWPLRYWIQYPSEEGLQERYWSTAKLAANMGIALSISLLVFFFFLFRNRQTSYASNRKLTQAMFDVGIAGAILIVPMIALALEYRIAAQHQRLGRSLSRYGNYYLSSWVPEVISGQIPKGMVHSFRRLRQAYLIRPTDDVVRSVGHLPTIVTLDISDSEVNLDSIAPLPKNVHFAALHLDKVKLDDGKMQAISQMKWLAHLRLSRTNLDAEKVRRLDHLELLRSVDFRRTPLLAADLGTPDWHRRVKSLFLARVPDGQGDQLTIDGWPMLERLGVTRFSSKMNAEGIDVHLSNLPRLQYLQLDRNQKHRLVLRNLPRLAHLDEGLTRFEEVLGRGEYIPGLPWMEDLVLDGVTSMQGFGCYSPDLKKLELSNVPNLRTFKLGAFQLGSLGEKKFVETDPDECQVWIRSLGENAGPSTIELTGLPLQDLDLKSLSSNDRLRHLHFTRCSIPFSRVKHLDGLEQLESLSISTIPLKGDQMGWLLKHFPNLESLKADASQLIACDLTAGTKLRDVELKTLEQATDVRVYGTPSLSTGVRMVKTAKRLEVRDARSFYGLAVEKPWPKDARVGGFRKLRWFAAGGRHLGDDVFDEVLQCKDIGQLTLAYSSVSREKLKKIGSFTGLNLLAVPGGDVDDDVTSHWQRLQFVWDVNLDDTAISFGTMEWLSRISSLRRLSLNRVAFNETAARVLGELRQVSELHLAGVKVDPARLRPILESGNLEILNLSGWKLDSELGEMLPLSYALRVLKLHDSEVDLESLAKLLEQLPELHVDLGPEQEGFDRGFLVEDLPEPIRQRLINHTPSIWQIGNDESVLSIGEGRIDCEALRPQSP
ncbi:MAG: hypothetical protein AB8B91_00065 [Rubripirellula sp.]